MTAAIRILLVMAILVFAAAAEAAVKIYLFSKVDITGGKITLGDIGTIEARDAVRRELESMEIAAGLLEDGYIDRNEVVILVQDASGETPVVFGSAVRISSRGEKEKDFPVEENIIMEKGTPVRVFYSFKGITIESGGTAMESGESGDLIQVRVKGRAISARVIDKFTVRKEQ